MFWLTLLGLLTISVAVALIPAALSPNLFVLALLVGLSGVLVAPALATAYVLTDSLASPRARNQAGNWVNTSYNAGGSAGSLLSGQLIGRIPLSACLPVLAAPALLAVVPLLRVRLTATEQQPPHPAIQRQPHTADSPSRRYRVGSTLRTSGLSPANERTHRLGPNKLPHRFRSSGAERPTVRIATE